MVPYNCERSCKQIIRMKSIRFGHKNVVLMSSNGQPHFVDPYYGKKYSEGKDLKKISLLTPFWTVLWKLTTGVTKKYN